MEIYSWNVNGVRAAQRKGLLDWMERVAPDVLCLQETKAAPDQVDDVIRNPVGYHSYWARAERKGYSGVALFARQEPLDVSLGLGISEFDREGRTIVADFGSFVLITAYFPNGSRDHSRVPFKLAYCDAFLEFCNGLRDTGRTVVFCGDLNTAHREIDIARPKENRNSTGFLPEERAWIDRVLEAGYVDIFRSLHPDQEGAYSWWAYWGGARDRNVGWRLDYFFISDEGMAAVRSARIHTDVKGSDHCPVSIHLEL